MGIISNNRKFEPVIVRGMWLAVAACIAIVAGTFVNILSYFAFILAAIAIILLPEEDALCTMLVLMSFANIFKSSPDAQSFFTYLLLIYVGFYFVKKRYIHKTFLVTLGLVVIYLLCQIVLSVNLLRMIKFVVNLMFIYLAIDTRANLNMKKIFLAYILGVIAASSIAALNIIPNLSNYIGSNDSWVESEKLFRFAGLYGDPNYYSVNVIISLTLIVILNDRKELSTLSSVLLASLLVLFVGLTMSKSAFLMLLFPVLFLVYAKNKKGNYWVVLGVCIACVVFLSQLLAGKIELFNNVLARLDGATDVNSLTTGRFYLWLNYLYYLIAYPGYFIFGRGFGSSLLYGRAAHNTYIDMFFYLGFVGTIFLILAMSTLINIKRPRFKRNFLNHSVWICIAVMYFFLSELFYFDLAFHMIIAILVSRINMNPVNGG